MFLQKILEMSYKKTGAIGVTASGGGYGLNQFANFISFKGGEGATILNIVIDPSLIELLTRFAAVISAVGGAAIVCLSLWKAIDERIHIMRERGEKRRRAKRIASFKEIRRKLEAGKGV